MSQHFGCSHVGRAQGGASRGARAFPLPGDRPQWGRARPYSLEAISLELDLDLEGEAVEGRARLTLKRVDAEARYAVLDAIAFELSEVLRVEGDAVSPAAHRYDGGRLEIDLSDLQVGDEAVVRVAYRATPRRGLYFTKPDATRPDKPAQVWSQCQDQDGRHFFPCQDHPGQRMRTELAVWVPKGWFALSNGVLAERRDEAERSYFRWAQEEPHPAYLVSLAAGEMDEAHADADGVPVDYYVPKGRGGDIERSLGRTPEMIRLFAERLSTPYPWAKYAQVVVADFIFGGMENTSATTLFERALLDERAAIDVDMESLVAHELAHQWFGDLVTCRDWGHAWLNEGFATYLEHVWKEHSEGRDDYLYGLEQDLELYLAEHGGRYGRPVVTNIWSSPIDLFDRHLYQKGGLVLHALRQSLGDRAFWAGLAHYLERHRGTSVETRDLLRALEESSGRSLEELFHQWVERPGHPDLEITVEHREGTLDVKVVQKQARGDEGHFHLRLPLEVHLESGVEQHTLEVAAAKERFALPVASEPKMVLFDLEMTAPGPVKWKLPTAMLVRALAEAPVARGRWLAARALARVNERRAIDGLAAALAADAFWAVRAEAAKALGEQRTEQALEPLLRAAGDADARVRRAVATALGRFREDTSAADALLAWVERGDRSYLVEAALMRALGRTRDERARTVLEGTLLTNRGSWGEVVPSGAADGLVALLDEAVFEPLLEVLAEVRTPSTLRRAILAALTRTRDITVDPPALRRVREAAEARLEDFDPNVRIAATRLVSALRDRRGLAVLDRLIDRDLDGRVRRAAREARRALAGSREGGPELQALRDKMDELEKELFEQKGRLERLGARSDGERSQEKGANSQ